MFKDKKVIIFDMDGTLIDSVGIWNRVDIELITELGCKECLDETEIQKQRDDKLREFSKCENPYIEYCAFLSNKYGALYSGEETLKIRYNIAQKYLRDVIEYKDNVPELLKLLKDNGYILVIASTTRRNNMDIYCNENKNIIGKANISDYFTLVYTREDAKEIKPNPEIYLTVAKKLNVSKNQCLIFEDSLIGIEAANNAGIESVAMYDKYSDEEREEINSLATYKFKNYAEVIEILKIENSLKIYN